MREFLLLPVVIVGAAVALPMVLVGLTIVGAIMFVGEKTGWAKIGGLHRDEHDC